MLAQRSSRWFRLPYLVLTGLLLAAGSLAATDVKFPADGSGFLFTLPDGWTTDGGRDGNLKCTSGEGDISFDLLPGKIINDPKANLADAAAALAEAAGLKDVRTQVGGEEPNDYGVKITGIIVHGSKDDVEYVGAVSVLTLPSGERCAFQCFGTRTMILVHSKDIRRITGSFRPAK